MQPQTIHITNLQKTLGAIILMLLFGHQCFSSFKVFGVQVDIILYLSFLMIFYYLVYLIEVGEYFFPTKHARRSSIFLRGMFILFAFLILGCEKCEMQSDHDSHMILTVDLFMLLKTIIVLIPDVILKVVFGMRKTLPGTNTLVPVPVNPVINAASLRHQHKKAS